MNLTLFIDADNISYYNYNKIIDRIKTQIDNPKTTTKVFGNFSNRSLNRWKKLTKDPSIDFINIPIIKKKNITDHVIIVEAMKALYTTEIDIFILASDDVDFLPLYKELRNSKKNIWQVSQNIEQTKYLDDYVDIRIDLSKTLEDKLSDEILNEMIDRAFKEKSIDGCALMGDVKFWLDINEQEFSMDKTPFKKFSKLVSYLDKYEIIVDESEFKMIKKPN